MLKGQSHLAVFLDQQVLLKMENTLWLSLTEEFVAIYCRIYKQQCSQIILNFIVRREHLKFGIYFNRRLWGTMF